MSMSVEMILRLVDRATGPLRGVESELNRLKSTADKVNAAQAAGGKVRASDWLAAQKGAAAAAKETGAYEGALLGAGARVAGFTAAAGVGFAAYGLKQAVSFEKAMAQVKKKVDLDPGASWRDVEGMINRTSREIGIARDQTAALTAQAAAAGVEYKDLGEFTRLAAKASASWDMAPKEAADELAKIKAQTQWTIPQLKAFSDQIAYLDANSAASAKDIVEMFGRAGASAKAAGVPLNTTLAALTALKSTGMQESTSATFWNAFTSRLATMGMAGRGAKDAAEGLKALGLSAKQVSDGMKTDATKTMIDVLDRLEKSPDKAKIGVQLFGKQWWDEAARAGQALSEILKQLEAVNSGRSAGALDKNLKIDLDTTANHLERFKAMVSEIGDGMMRWALPPINSQLESMLHAFEAMKKTGFLPGPDGKPIDRVTDKTPVPFSEATRERWLKGIQNRAHGENLAAYEMRLGLNREPPPPPPKPIFMQPRPQGLSEIPSGPSLPTFAGLNGQNVAPRVDLSHIQQAAAEAERAGQAIKTGLDVTATPKVDTGDLGKVAGEAQAAGGAFTSALNVTARPTVDTSSIAAALGMVRELNGALSGIGAKAAAAGAAVSRGVAAGSHALHDGPEAH